MDHGHHFRRAEPHEAKELEELQNRSASHWDYPDGYFDWAGDAGGSLSPTSATTRSSSSSTDGRKLGFYSFTEGDDGLLLDRMFLDVDQIGRGLGRVLWQHAVQTARDLGVSEFVIGADPNAAPFYEAMGARWYAAKPTEEPTWTVQMYRFTTPRQRASAPSSTSAARAQPLPHLVDEPVQRLHVQGGLAAHALD